MVSLAKQQDLYDRIRQTTAEFIASYSEDHVGNDIEALSSTLTPDCRRYLLPISITAEALSLAAGVTNEQYEQQMLAEFMHVWSEWHVVTKDIMVDERARQAVTDIITYMTTKKGQKYDFELVFKLQMTEDVKQIEKVEEFIDTAMAAQMIAENQVIAEALQK